MKHGLVWEEIHGFSTSGEYDRFVKYIETQVANGHAREVTPDSSYGAGEIYGGRWFQDSDTGAVWRLVPPDLPFKGLWEAVERTNDTTE